MRLLKEIWLGLLLAAVAAGCSRAGGGAVADSQAILDSLDSIAALERDANDITAEAVAYADSVVGALPLRRKAAMLFMPALFARADAANMNLLEEYVDSMGVGGIVLLKGICRARR